MKTLKIKKELIRPDFLNLCEIVHIHPEISLNNQNKECLTLKITFYNPKSVTLYNFLSYFKSIKNHLKMINWDEQETYDFDTYVYSDFTFITYNKNIIKTYKSNLNNFPIIFDYTHSLFNLTNNKIHYQMSNNISRI